MSENERSYYFHLIESINWFFFDLFILGYVEDPVTGLSFRFPGGLKIAIYVEVHVPYSIVVKAVAVSSESCVASSVCTKFL